MKPEQPTEKVKPLLDKLGTAGVRLTAFELGNEINTSRFNSDLPEPGQWTRVAFVGSQEVLAALKDLRDHSKLNQQTPIISAGLAQKLGTTQVR